MDNREAIKFAKQYVADVFSEERISDIGLEGISRDDDIWEILIGFDRPVTNTRSIAGIMEDEMKGTRHRSVRRLYKKVLVSDTTGTVTEMLHVE